jgi:hypothetical protein
VLPHDLIMLRGWRAARFSRIVSKLDLVSFAALADWLAREPGSIARDERRRAQAMEDFRDAVLRGEFGPPRKPEVAWLANVEPVEPLGRGHFPLRPRNGQVGWMHAWGSDMTPDLWAPRELCLRWLRAREVDPPPWLSLALKAQPKTRNRGRPAAPIWVAGEKFIDGWLDENGFPEPGDGGRSKLEAAVGEFLAGQTEQPPARSTIQNHVTKRIHAYKEKVGAGKAGK